MIPDSDDITQVKFTLQSPAAEETWLPDLMQRFCGAAPANVDASRSRQVIATLLKLLVATLAVSLLFLVSDMFVLRSVMAVFDSSMLNSFFYMGTIFVLVFIILYTLLYSSA